MEMFEPGLVGNMPNMPNSWHDLIIQIDVLTSFGTIPLCTDLLAYSYGQSFGNVFFYLPHNSGNSNFKKKVVCVKNMRIPKNGILLNCPKNKGQFEGQGICIIYLGRSNENHKKASSFQVAQP